MKYLFTFPVLLLSSAYAGDAALYQTSLYTGTLFLFLLMLAIIIVQMKRAKHDKEMLKEKESKINWLRQIHAEKDQKHLQQIKEMEKEILKLTHTIESLELKLKEGTKNQVVAKLEALQRKRQIKHGE